jgi:hypothetical protein
VVGRRHGDTFLSVVFIAPVMPPLHEEPNPIAETSRIEASLKDRGTVTSVESSFVDPSAGIEETSTPQFPFCSWLSADISFELLSEETLGLSIVQTDTRTIFFKEGLPIAGTKPNEQQLVSRFSGESSL